MGKELTILNLEWHSSPSRDRQMATLVANYLRLLGYKVIEDNIFNGYSIINRVKPDMLFITNATGAMENQQIVKYAKKKGIQVVTFISEGNFKDAPEYLDEFLWGWNSDKILFEDLHLQWTSRTRNLSLKKYPELDNQIKVSGGVGFDLYKIQKQIDKVSLLKKYNLDRYKKVVGVGCWDFIHACPSDTRYRSVVNSISKSELDRFKSDRDSFSSILKGVVINNEDTLFLLKEHPGTCCGHYASAIDGCEDLENTLIIKNEESLADCISISDFWVVYDSTTAMEAWLYGKETALLNPSGIDFPRDVVHKGSTVFKSLNDFEHSLNSFYNEGHLYGFDEKKEFRKIIIKDSMEYDDGLNHVRAGNEIIDILNKNDERELNINFPKLYWFKFNLRWVLSPFFKRYRDFYIEHRKSFNKKELKSFSRRRLNEQLEFYKKHNLSLDDLTKIRCVDINE